MYRNSYLQDSQSSGMYKKRWGEMSTLDNLDNLFQRNYWKQTMMDSIKIRCLTCPGFYLQTSVCLNQVKGQNLQFCNRLQPYLKF